MKNTDFFSKKASNALCEKELINLRGGVVEECTHVTCYGGNQGEWYGVYDTAGELQDAISQYCSSGMAEIEEAYGMDCWGID